MVLAGDGATGVKDPVITRSAAGAAVDGAGEAASDAIESWQMWLCCHPLADAGHEDRMTTRRLTSADGLQWTDRGEVLAGRPGRWDARGARVTAVLPADPTVVLYDGRPDAASNWHERTGVARWDGARLVADDSVAPLASPWSDGAFRYVSCVALPDGRTRFYAEAARPDGAHDLVTCVR